MKKRLLGLVSIICLIAVIFSFGAVNVSADAQFVDLTTLSFENLEVGATSTSADNAIQTGNDYFDRIHPSGGTMVVMEENGEKFVRTTATTSTKYVSFRPIAKEGADLPVQDYQITITYRLSDDFANNAAQPDKNFVIRARGTSNSDETILHRDNYDSAKGVWTTKTLVSTPKDDLLGYWLFVYAKAGCYFDIKSIEWKSSAEPLFDQKADFNAATPADVTYRADLKGNELSKVEVWNENTEEFEVLDAANYVIGDGTITVKASYLSTLTNGLKSIICTVNNVRYATVIYVYNSTVAEPTISLKDPDYNPSTPDTPDTPAEDKGGCGSVIGTTSAILSSLLLAGSIVVFKKKD